MRNELLIVSMIRHPYITELREVYEQKDKIWISMECISGGELSEYIKNYALDEKEIAKIMKQAFEAIEYLHACGIMHRDLKPENVLVQLENTVYSDETVV